MPSRVSSAANRCRAFSASADCPASNPVSIVFRVHGSARSVAQNAPGGHFLIRSPNAADAATVPSSLFSYISQPVRQHSCPTFSSVVIRSSKSSTRSSVGASARLYTGVPASRPHAPASRPSAIKAPALISQPPLW